MTLQTVAHQALLSLEFSRQEYWNGLLFPTPGDHHDPVIEPKSLKSPVLADGFFTTSATWEAPKVFKDCLWKECYLWIVNTTTYL